MRGEKILVYTTSWCPDCHRAKAWLREQGIPFEEIDIEQNPEAARVVMEHNGGRRRVPTFVIGGRYYGNPSIPELEQIFHDAGDLFREGHHGRASHDHEQLSGVLSR